MMETQTPGTIYTIVGDVSLELLVRKDGLLDNDHERTTWTEYRFKEPYAHVDADGQPCTIASDTIVRRDVHVTIKKWPDAMTSAVGQL